MAEIRYGGVAGRMPLSETELRFFQEVVAARAVDIVTKWMKERKEKDTHFV